MGIGVGRGREGARLYLMVGLSRRLPLQEVGPSRPCPAKGLLELVPLPVPPPDLLGAGKQGYVRRGGKGRGWMPRGCGTGEWVVGAWLPH